MKKLIHFVTTHFTAKQNMTIANGLLCIAVVINMIDMLQNGFELRLAPVLITLGIAAIGAVYLFVFVRCPHCGDKLKGLKNKSSLPDRCPNCNRRLDKLPRPKKEEDSEA